MALGGLNCIRLGYVLVVMTWSLVVLWRQWRNRVLVRESQSWQATTGQIAESSWKSRGYLGAFWVAPRVSYWYVVDGARYVGNRASFGDEWDTLERSQQRHYPFGATVQVYYDPAHPQRSALDRRGYYDVASIMVAVFILVVGLVLVAAFVFGW